MKEWESDMIATVLFLSVMPTVLCAFAFVYGLVFASSH